MPCLLKSSEALKDALSSETLNVLHFAEEWAPQCEQTDIFLDYLSKRDEYSNVKFLKVHPTDLPEAASLYNVTAVPTVVLLHGTKAVDRVDGVNAKEIGEKVALHMKLEPVDLNERLKALINRNKVMLFMKGSRNEPRCGFSKQIVGILESIGATYDTFDILEDEEVRQGLKVYSEWPTYPQLYISGELIGGLDIVKEMNNSGELKKMLDA